MREDEIGHMTQAERVQRACQRALTLLHPQQIQHCNSCLTELSYFVSIWCEKRRSYNLTSLRRDNTHNEELETQARRHLFTTNPVKGLINTKILEANWTDSTAVQQFISINTINWE